MIGNFTYNTPTTLYFGKDAIKDLPGVIGSMVKTYFSPTAAVP